MNYLYTKYENDAINDENYTIIDFVQYIYKSFSNDFQINIREEDFAEFLQQHMPDFRMVVERQPTLWRYNISGYVLANVFDDQDIIYPKEQITPNEENTELDEELLEISSFFGQEYDLGEESDI